MARFYGKIGYATQTETAPGVWVDDITEKDYAGEVIRNTRRLYSSENLNDNLDINNLFSIIADPYATNNFHAMKYIEWMGSKWKITNVEVQRPRLILTVGGIYNE